MMVSSPSLPGWGPGVPLSPDRGSPSNGSHKSQDSGFSDSESSPPNPKPLEEGSSSEEHHEEQEDKVTSLSQLPLTPLARIPRACLTRYKTTISLNKCLNSTWSGEVLSESPGKLRFNQSDCALSVFKSKVSSGEVSISVEEARTSFVIESEEEGEKELPKNVSVCEDVVDKVDVSCESVGEDSSLDSSDTTTENQTALFIPRPSPQVRPKSPPASPVFLRPATPSASPVFSRPATPPRANSPGRFYKTPVRLSSWNSDLDVSETPGAPKHCSTPKSVSQTWGVKSARRCGDVNLDRRFQR